MKLLHTSDWHIGRMLFDFSLLEDQQFFIDWLYELIALEKPDGLIIAGDLYHRHVPSTEAIKLLDEVFYHIITELHTPILCIAGNHDSGQRLSFASRLYSQNGLFLEGAITKMLRKVTLQDQFGDVHFFMLPYLQPSDVRPLFPDEDIKTYEDAYGVLLDYNRQFMNFSDRNILIAHGFFSPIDENKDLSVITSDSEISIGGMDIVSTKCLNNFDYVALGHLHAPQKLGKDSIRYSGSPLKYSTSEAAHTKSVSLVELGPKGEFQISLKPIPAKRDVRILKGSFDQLIAPPKPDSDGVTDYIFAEITDEKIVLHAMEKLRVLYPNILGLRFHTPDYEGEELQIGSQHNQKVPISTLFWEFAKAVNQTLPTPESETMMSELFDEVSKQENL